MANNKKMVDDITSMDVDFAKKQNCATILLSKAV